MLFAVIYQPRSQPTEESQKRGLTLFSRWEPPAGFVFKSHYSFADGSGGLAIVETDSAEAALKAQGPWVPFFSFQMHPLVDVSEAVQIGFAYTQWRDSIS